MGERLALLGGPPLRSQAFPAYNGIGLEEKRVVSEVLDSGVLSGFLGTWSDRFHGGPRVRDLERRWASYFNVKHAVAVNSATSGLYAALAATRVGPDDEVIVSPYTMSASAVGPVLYGATPVFADIDPDTYCISRATIEQVLSPRTRAIVVVDLFGHPADIDPIMELATEHGLLVIEDAAQAPGGLYHGRWAGTLGHIGVFSLNYHKTIHSGEGGIVVTDDDELAERVRLVRNHGEAVVKDKGRHDLADLIGFNYRLPEIEAAIAAEQLAKLETLTQGRIERAGFLRDRWEGIRGLHLPVVRDGCRHVYYQFALQYDEQVLGVPRARFAEAVRAEGVPLAEGYVEPLYLLPIYQRRGAQRGPAASAARPVSYEKGICPTAELMYEHRLLYTALVHTQLSRDDVEDVAAAVLKVVEGIDQLRSAGGPTL